MDDCPDFVEFGKLVERVQKKMMMGFMISPMKMIEVLEIMELELDKKFGIK